MIYQCLLAQIHELIVPPLLPVLSFRFRAHAQISVGELVKKNGEEDKKEDEKEDEKEDDD